jgi:hypothetical protein
MPRNSDIYLACWIARLNWLGDHPAERANLVAGCLLLGHEPSGEQLMTNPPIHICWWCAREFRIVKK